ncbi:antiviral reverse transcriptase Drt3a [Hydrogenophaga flava]|uniref:antiviral reverse transcriptase Drt3a n=1 Tax=Hydrogenophaga flava TaxID=65657 RepID=UPI000A033548|nr:antiviral reverse transcriptase Drt3a [Hydrogenophaga flava]
MDPSYSEKSFWRLLRKGDVQNFSLGKSRSEIRTKLQEVEAAAASSSFHFSAFTLVTRNGFNAYTTNSANDEFILRKVADNIKRALNIKPSDRAELIPTAIQLVREARDCTIHKLDIELFFESISKDDLIQKIKLEQSLDSRTKDFIQILLKSPQLKNLPGIPRGLSVSPILAEYYLSNLERFCRRISYSYFYSRYVDDMLFFCHKPAAQLEAEVEAALPKGLSLNLKKSSHIFINKDGYLAAGSPNQSISYLGYEIFPALSKSAPIRISIPKKKIEKIKTRIALSFLRFSVDQNFCALKNRIQFISSNFNVGGTKQSGKLYSGIHYNHKYMDPQSAEAVFQEIDQYLQKLIYAKKGSFGKRLGPLLTNKQRKDLASHSLLAGHRNQVYRHFTNKTLGEVKEVWQHA